MRTKNSIKNITISIISQIIMTLLGFISRKVFLDNLGIDYLGVNGLLTNVLSLLALLEGGIGSSITYNLYKPLAENDEENSRDIDALIAEAEQRGYLRGLNERAEKQLQRPSVGSAPEQERREYTAENNEVMILNNIRKSVWDI